MIPRSAGKFLVRRWRWVVGLCIVAVLAAWLGPIFVGDNFAEVVPEQVYRSAQPAPDTLEQWHSKHKLATVINLRGGWNNDDWWLAEREVCKRLGIRMVDVKMTASKLPKPEELAILMDALQDPSARPLLIHCRNGADRSGLASAIARILAGQGLDDSVDQALRIGHGHLPFGSATAMDDFFGLYRKWLTKTGRHHSPEAFAHWARDVYVPYGYRAKMEIIAMPEQVDPGEPIPFTVRATNLSNDPWELTTRQDAGYLLAVERYGGQKSGRKWPFFYYPHRTGRTVAPGQTVEWQAELPAPPAAGEYRFAFDMWDPQEEYLFVMYGSERAKQQVRVGPPTTQPGG